MDRGQCKDWFQHVQKVQKDCWIRFRKEYLNELRQANIYRKQKAFSHELRMGDVVLIKDDDPAPQTAWRMEKVRDIHVRGGKVKGTCQVRKANNNS